MNEQASWRRGGWHHPGPPQRTLPTGRHHQGFSAVGQHAPIRVQAELETVLTNEEERNGSQSWPAQTEPLC